MIARYFISSLLKDKTLWGWGVGFMFMWLYLGAFVFGSNATSQQGWLIDASSWFSIIGLISGSLVATTISYSIYYSTSSLAYGFRYTKLKPGSYVFNLTAGASLVSAIIGCFIILFTIVLFSESSGYSIIPAMPVQALLLFFLTGIFMFLFSLITVILVNNYLGMRSSSFANFLPQLLSYIFGFSEFGSPLPPDVVYASPFSDIPRLMYMTFSGKESYLNMSDLSGPVINSYILFASLLIWISVMFVMAMALIRRIKAKSIEEGRHV
ncbi:MAG: hypothetical protein M1414_05705 [Candidatus Thermoplasmatota archaeon]|jgi:hypothetical protein|nr:hypothetical protein [Candidatus Thermoplasmatota archaeon]